MQYEQARIASTHPLRYPDNMNFSTKPDPKKLDDVLNSSSLISILKKAQMIEAFNTAFTRYLPTKLIMHCQIMNIENSILVIGADDAAWLTRLRYEEQNIINYFQNEPNLPHILGIKYKIFY